MLKNHKLALSISNMSWEEFRRQLEYKSLIFGITIRWFPGSKIYSGCDCEICGQIIDRDLNATINLRNYETRCSQ